jgi:glycosyltransferase involved in cell wall biosynthesis
MRIVVCHCEYRARGGEEESFEAETAMLHSAGHEVRTVRLKNSDLGSVAGAANCIWNRRVYRHIKAVVKEHQAQVAWFHNIDFHGPSLIYGASAAGAAVIMDLRNERRLIAPSDLLRGKFYNGNLPQTAALAAGNLIHVKRLWRHVDQFVANSKYIRDRHLKLGWPVDLIVVKPPPVYPEPEHSSRTWLERSGGRPTSEYRPVKRQFLFAGRLVPEKGVGVLLEAWEQLGDDAPELLIAGAGALGQRAWPFGPRSLRIRWLGHLPHTRVLELMGESLAVIVPTTSKFKEPFGRTVIEAHGTGCLSIATTVGGLPETIPTILIDPDDPGELASAVRTVLQPPPEKLAEWRAQSRRTYEEHFSGERQLAALEGCMRLAIDERSRKTARERLRTRTNRNLRRDNEKRTPTARPAPPPQGGA